MFFFGKGMKKNIMDMRFNEYEKKITSKLDDIYVIILSETLKRLLS